MSTKEFYVGTRKMSYEISKIIGRDVFRLNEGLSKKLRSSVLKKGIKKTEQGKKLIFYSVKEKELNTLLNQGIDILVKVDEDKLQNVLNQINIKYPRKMDLDLSKKYKEELENGLLDSVEIIGKDKNIRKKSVRKNDYLYKNSKLGKLIYETTKYGYLGEVEEFFIYIFHEQHIVNFSYRNDPQSGDLETFEWDKSKRLSKNVYLQYKKSFTFLTKWSWGDKYSRVELYEQGGSFLMCGGNSYNGFLNEVCITTTKHVKELYKDFKKQYNPKDFTGTLLDIYNQYGSRGRFFKDYTPISWGECKELYENIFIPIIKETQGDNGYYGYDTVNREKMRDLLLCKRGKSWMNLEYGFWIKKYYLKEDISKQDILDCWRNDMEIENLPKEESEILYKKMFDEVTTNGRLENVYNHFN